MKKIIVNELPMLMIILSIVQVFLMIVQIAYSVMLSTGMIQTNGLIGGRYILLVFAVVFILNLFILRQVLRTLRGSYQLIHEQEQTIKNIEALNNRIRAQRHDFLNHIQVLYGMVEVEAYDELRKYLHKLYGDIETANTFMKTDVIAVNALLQAKYSHAKKRGILFQLEIGARLTEAPLTEWDMCKLLGNLIDNAINATEDYDGEKMVLVRISEALDCFMFTVANTGRAIHPEHLAHLFEPGFTTKKDKGEGMGLYIVKQIADTHHGTVTVDEKEEKENRTEFTVRIPKVLSNLVL